MYKKRFVKLLWGPKRGLWWEGKENLTLLFVCLVSYTEIYWGRKRFCCCCWVATMAGFLLIPAVGAAFAAEGSKSVNISLINLPNVLAMFILTLKPFDLRCWSIALLIPARNSENNRRFAGRVKMCSSNHLIADIALILFAHVDARECELRCFRWVWIFDGEIDWIFGDFTLRLTWWLPR